MRDRLKKDIEIRAGESDIPTLQSEAVFQNTHFFLYFHCVVCMQQGYATYLIVAPLNLTLVLIHLLHL